MNISKHLFVLGDNFKEFRVTSTNFNILILGVILTLGSMCTFSLPGLAAVDPNKVLTLALTTEPPNLNHIKATDTESFFILGHTMEGLTRYDKNQKIVEGLAEKWKIDEKTATFHIRKNAKWSDGKPITAHDFVFGWRTVLDPKTASEYSFILYHLKNAEKINKGEMPVTELGVQAIDNHTLKVTFEKPCGYFDKLVSFAVYYPLREDFYKAQGEKYAANAENLVSSGPFKLTKWVHGASLRMEQNEHYYGAQRIHLQAIDIPYITPDDLARFNLFKSKKIDLVALNRDTLVNAQREKFDLKKFPDGALFFLQFNFRKDRPTANKKLRKALLAVFNPQEYISRVVSIPGTVAGTGLVPSYMMGINKPFRKENPTIANKPNVAEAKKLLAEALKELGLKTPPSLTYLSTDSPLAVRESEYFQALFKSTLGIDLKIDRQIFKQRLAKQNVGDFDICSAGWGPDYNDPMTFVDLFTSWNNNNHGKWVNDGYDGLVRKATDSVKPVDRMKFMADAEKILLEETPIIPLYERTIMYTTSPRIQGVARRAVGFDPDYTEAKIVK